MLRCQICKKLLKWISWAHLKTHGTTIEEYKKKYNVKHLQCKSLRKATSKRFRENTNGVGNKSRTGLKCSEENKEKSRIRMNKMYEDGTLKPGTGVRCKMYPIMNYVFGKEVKVQGELEVRFAKLLNRLGIRWVKPKYKTYALNGKKKKYFCDFWLRDERLYIEVKSRYYYNLHKEEVKAKKQMMIERGKRKGFIYKIMFEKNIREFELNVVDVAETLIKFV